MSHAKSLATVIMIFAKVFNTRLFLCWLNLSEKYQWLYQLRN